MSLEHLITDRTSADVARWRKLHDKGFAAMNDAERAEWLGFMKGRYTAEDMNRVESAVEALVSEFLRMGYNNPNLVTKTSWGPEECPSVEDIERYFSNVEKLKSMIAVKRDTPTVPSVAEKLDYRRANDLEKVLLSVEHSLTAIPRAWYYAGEINSGEV